MHMLGGCIGYFIAVYPLVHGSIALWLVSLPLTVVLAPLSLASIAGSGYGLIWCVNSFTAWGRSLGARAAGENDHQD
jgi:hypothetical protein